MTPKLALVTGGSRGIGRDIALSVAQKGLDVVITYHQNKSSADEVVSLINATGSKGYALQLDSRKLDTFDSFYQQLSEYLSEWYDSKQFDYLINNAGTGLYTPFLETSEEQFDEMMDIHFKGVYFLTQKAVPFINNGGGIINISSGLARFTFPNCSAYASMKGGVEVFTRYLAKELGSRNIKANVVAPGAVATDFGGGGNRDNEERRSMIANLTALGRVGEPEDIGSVVAFLCTHDAHWVTGQRIEASGGTML
jgi:NAD(P)-dependent dehydrogenase (short-subunit alcohol dehydrogenase family)